MKDNGIGRPSTRANIIETLFRRQYIEKKRKNLIATPTGIGLIDTIQNQILKSAELTGDWERKIRLIEKGEYNLDLFKSELYAMVRELTDEVIFNTPARSIQIDSQPIKKVVVTKPKVPQPKIEELTCPKCKTAKMMKGKTAVGCSNYKACGFKIPFELLGKKLTSAQLISLIESGKTGSMKGFIIHGSATPKNGKLILDKDFNVSFD